MTAGASGWLGVNSHDTKIQSREHVIPDGRISRVAMRQWILINPLDHSLLRVEQFLTLNPLNKFRFHLQVRAGISEHDNPRLCAATGHWNGNNVTQFYSRAVVVVHGVQ